MEDLNLFASHLTQGYEESQSFKQKHFAWNRADHQLWHHSPFSVTYQDPSQSREVQASSQISEQGEASLVDMTVMGIIRRCVTDPLAYDLIPQSYRMNQLVTNRMQYKIVYCTFIHPSQIGHWLDSMLHTQVDINV